MDYPTMKNSYLFDQWVSCWETNPTNKLRETTYSEVLNQAIESDYLECPPSLVDAMVQPSNSATFLLISM